MFGSCKVIQRKEKSLLECKKNILEKLSCGWRNGSKRFKEIISQKFLPVSPTYKEDKMYGRVEMQLHVFLKCITWK
jgi:hypothetical protein